jgi:hypothetical protein
MVSYYEVDLLVGEVLDIGSDCTLTVVDVDGDEVTFRLDGPDISDEIVTLPMGALTLPR